MHTHWIHLPQQQGKLYAQSWVPAHASTSAAPIVLMHDSLGAVALWRDFPERLAQLTQRTVIAYDRLGFGQSDARQDVLSTQFVQEEAAYYFPQVRAQLGFKRFVLLGHSVGGGMALSTAAHLGADCQAVITIAAQAFVEELTTAGIREARAQFQDPAQITRLAKYHGDKARWVVDAWTETWLSNAFAQWSLDQVLSQVQCPVLALHGEHDEYGTRAHPQRIADGVSGPSMAVLIPGAHHTPHREMPDEVLAHIQRFLQAAEPA